MSSERIVVALVTPAEGKGPRVEELLVAMTKSVEANEPGALRYHLHKQIDSENPQYVVVETYKDKAAFDVHMSSDYFKALVKSLEEESLLGAPPAIVPVASLSGFESR